MRFPVIIFIAAILQSCYKPGEIQIQNNVSNAKLTDIKWGDIYIESELIPGQTSSKIKNSKDEQKLPSSKKISFIMAANQTSIYLETVGEYLLNEDDDVLFVIDNNTPVLNPNQ